MGLFSHLPIWLKRLKLWAPLAITMQDIIVVDKIFTHRSLGLVLTTDKVNPTLGVESIANLWQVSIASIVYPPFFFLFLSHTKYVSANWRNSCQNHSFHSIPLCPCIFPIPSSLFVRGGLFSTRFVLLKSGHAHELPQFFFLSPFPLDLCSLEPTSELQPASPDLLCPTSLQRENGKKSPCNLCSHSLEQQN